MTITPQPPEDRPIDLGDLPEEEGVSTADAAERVEREPEDQDNREELR